jgi:hypothetical protein
LGQCQYVGNHGAVGQSGNRVGRAIFIRTILWLRRATISRKLSANSPTSQGLWW